MIDWQGELQVIAKPAQYNDKWEDVIVVWHNEWYVIGWTKKSGPSCVVSWNTMHFQFRNKPPEPKRVKCWVNLYSNNSGIVWFTKEAADRCSSDNRIACVRIDVPEGYGLENKND